MPKHSGYQKEANILRKRMNAAAVLIFVVDGKNGTAFSVQSPPDMIPFIIQQLRQTADELGEDTGQPTNEQN